MRDIISYDSIFEVKPESRKDLRALARDVRLLLGINPCQLYIDITRVLEKISELDPNFSFEIVDNDELKYDVQAQTDIVKDKILIKESVYMGAIRNVGRDRMTIAHELLHLILHQPSSLTLYRRNGEIPIYKNPEWQAECFAGELLMPYERIKNMSESEIVDKCKVSQIAAHYQLTHI